MPDWKPQGYPSVAPYLICDGAQRVIDFLTGTFGATVLRRYDGEDGSIVHCELQVVDSVVMLADAAGEWKAVPSMVHVYVSDVDEVYGRGLASGGTSAQQPTTRPGDPDRRGGVTDPAGNTWWIGTQL